MRTFILRLVSALGMLGAVAGGAHAAPTLNGIDAMQGRSPNVIQAYYDHHHHHHRHWWHGHWRYY